MLQETKRKNFQSLELLIRQNILKSYFKTGALIANGALGCTYIGDFPQEIKLKVFHFACHLGVAFQTIDDVIDFTSTAKALGKERLQDLRLGIINSPVLFALARANEDVREEIQEILKADELTLEESEHVYEFIQEHGGIEDATLLSYLFINEALSCLDYISNYYNGELQFHGLKELCNQVLIRNH